MRRRFELTVRFDAVVICNGKDTHAALRHEVAELRRRERTVALTRVRMEVDQQCS
jgi:hypothetical protein